MEKRGWLTILLIFGGLFVLLLLFSILVIAAFGEGDMGFGKPKIGVVEITGTITSSKKTLEHIRTFEHQESIQGVVVRIDSPGGAVAPSQEIYQAVEKLDEEKPLAVSMGSTAASGGYYIACGADHIIANPGTVTGSIGVITQLFNVKGVLEKLDIEVNTIKTGKFKDAGSPFRKMTDEERKYFAELLGGIYDQFVSAVAESRDLAEKKVREFADGRVFTGKRARELGLVDAVGSFHDAVAYVKDEAGIDRQVKLKYPEKDEFDFLSDAVESTVDSVTEEVQSRTTPVVEYRYTGPTTGK
ncbi:MAG: signal peptide peptidase SppA [Bradymonadaceae bacterium]